MPDMAQHLEPAYVARVVQVVRESEAGEDVQPQADATQIMQQAIQELLARIQANPHHYAMSNEEFSLFNYYRPNLGQSDMIRHAVERYWQRRHADAERAHCK